MPSEKKKLTVKGLVERIIEPHLHIKDTNSRLQARLTLIASLILAAICLVAGVIGILVGFKAILISGLFITFFIMSAACLLGRSENFLVGSILLVSGLILGGFLISAAFTDITIIVIILMATIVPAFCLSIVLLSLLAIIIIAVVVLISIGVLPLMSSISGGTELILFFGLIIVEGIFILIAWFRETAELQQQDEIGSLRGRLEERVEERTRYTRIAADIAQDILSSSSLDELLNRAVSLITARFGFSYIGIFLTDETGQYVELKAAQSSEVARIIRVGKRIKLGPPSLIGWVGENKQQRMVTRITEDPLLLEPDLLAGNQSELGMPILSSEKLLGVMDIQSTRTTMFDNETIVVLQMLASQVATAIQNVRLIEFEQGSVQEVVEVYLAGFRIVQAKNENEIYQLLQELFPKIPYISMFLTPEGQELKIVAKTGTQLPDGQYLPESITIPIEEVESSLSSEIFIGEGSRLNTLPYNLVRFLQQLQIFSVALIPVIRNKTISSILFIGTREKEPLNATNIHPYTDLVKQIASTLDRLEDTQKIEHHIADMGTVNLQLMTVAKLANDFSNAPRLDDVLDITKQVFENTPIAALLLFSEKNDFRIATSIDPTQGGGLEGLPESLDVTPAEILEQLGGKPLVADVSKLSSLHYAQFHPELSQFIEAEANKLPVLHPQLLGILEQARFQNVVFIPVTRNGDFVTLLIAGTRDDRPILPETVQAYSNLADLITSSRERILAAQRTERLIADTTQKADQRVAEIGKVNIQLKTVADLANDFSSASRLEEVLETTQRVFQNTQNTVLLLIAEKNNFRIATSTSPLQSGGLEALPERLDVAPSEILEQLGNKPLVAEVSKLSSLHYAQLHPDMIKFIEAEANELPSINSKLLGILEQASFQTVAFLPVIRNENLLTLLIVGAHDDRPIPPETVQVYANLADLVTSSLERILAAQKTDSHIAEMEIITTVGEKISTIRDLNTIFNTLHSNIRLLLGDVNFLVAIYDARTSSIAVPYMYEKGFEGGDVSSIDTFPLGEGLTSILIRTKRPLMIVEDAERRAEALGAKIVGKSAKSWLGTPLIVSDEVVGALIVQDVEHEYAFDDNDLQLLTTFSTQVAGAIYNARLLEQMNSRAIQLQTAAEVARDISGLLDLGELLNKAVTLIYERFNFYHAAIFLTESTNEFAIIREATGEAGTQMKRAGHKLKVGSKSIVGYVTGTGEPLIVNDTSRDSTYYANPLLPETRAEVAIPLKVGQRILGALDVQSVHAYSFGEEDISVLRILADQMAIAVINSELFADTQEHLSQHRLLHHVTTAAASGTTLEESLNSATQGLQVTLGGDRVSILLADKGKKILKVRSFAGYSEEIGKLEVPFGEGITGWVAVHQQPQRINDVTQDPRYIQVGSNIRSELAIPLSYRGDLLGVLNVESDQTSAYNENDEELLGTLGGSLAAIISNARLIEQVRSQVDHQRLLFEVTSKIRRSTDMQTIMATTAGELSKALGARRAEIKMGLTETAPEPEKRSEDTVSSSGGSE